MNRSNSGVNETFIRMASALYDTICPAYLSKIVMSDQILAAIRELLAGVPFREIHHEPTRTSEESANARGEPLQIGGKAILLKTDDVFRLFVLPADRKLD